MKIYNLDRIRNKVNNLENFSGFKLLDFPVNLDKEIYFKVVNKAKDFFSRRDEVLGLLLCGNVSGDGISDVDLLVVLKDGAKLSVDFLKALNQTERRVLVHNLFSIDETILKSFKYMVPFYKIKPLFIKGDFNLVTEYDLEIFYGKIFMVKNLISFLRSFLFKEIKIRGLLLLLNGMKYDLKIFGDCFPSHDSFKKEIENLRENWFFIGSEERLNLLFKLYRKGFLYLIDFFKNYDLKEVSFFLDHFSIKQVSNIYFDFKEEKEVIAGIGGRYLSFLKLIFESESKNIFDTEVLNFFSHLFEFRKNIGGDLSLPIPSPFVYEDVKGVKAKLFRLINRKVMEIYT